MYTVILDMMAINGPYHCKWWNALPDYQCHGLYLHFFIVSWSDPDVFDLWKSLVSSLRNCNENGNKIHQYPYFYQISKLYVCIIHWNWPMNIVHSPNHFPRAPCWMWLPEVTILTRFIGSCHSLHPISFSVTNRSLNFRLLNWHPASKFHVAAAWVCYERNRFYWSRWQLKFSYGRKNWSSSHRRWSSHIWQTDQTLGFGCTEKV